MTRPDAPRSATDAVDAFIALVRLRPVASDAIRIAPEALPVLGRLAEREQIGPWFAHRVRQTGDWSIVAASVSGAPVRDQLRLHARAFAAQRLLQEATITHTLALLEARGIGAVLLKGAAYAAIERAHAFLPHRESGDVDLLIAPGTADDAAALLASHGYRLASATPSVHSDHHHLPALISPLGGTVELHRAASLTLSPEASWQRLQQGARALPMGSTMVQIGSATELVWHALRHSLGDGAAGCTLRHLLTVADLLRTPDPIDWEQLRHLIDQPSPLVLHDSRAPIMPTLVRRWLSVAAWLSDLTLPAALQGPVDAPALLRRLLGFRVTCLERARARPVIAKHWRRYGEEAALAEFGFGPDRGPHWAAPLRRMRCRVVSTTYQSAYRLLPSVLT